MKYLILIPLLLILLTSCKYHITAISAEEIAAVNGDSVTYDSTLHDSGAGRLSDAFLIGREYKSENLTIYTYDITPVWFQIDMLTQTYLKQSINHDWLPYMLFPREGRLIFDSPSDLKGYYHKVVEK